VRQRNARWRSIPWMVKSSATLACSWTYSGELEEGRRFVEKAKRLNPNMAGLFLFQEFTSAYRQGHYAEALAVTVRMKMPGFFTPLRCERPRSASGKRRKKPFRSCWRRGLISPRLCRAPGDRSLSSVLRTLKLAIRDRSRWLRSQKKRGPSRGPVESTALSRRHVKRDYARA
jgi:hypothetical protein